MAKITIPIGRDCSFTFSFKDENGVAIDVSPSTSGSFAVKKDLSDVSPAILKIFGDGFEINFTESSASVDILAADTVSLAPGLYIADINMLFPGKSYNTDYIDVELVIPIAGA